MFQDDGSAPAVSVEPPKFNWTPPVPGAKKEAPKKAAAAAKKEEKEEKYSEDSLDPRVVALPGALALVAGLAALRGENFDLVMVKDSADLGVGYEPAIPKFLPPGTKAAPLKNNKKKTTVSGKGLFGKK